MNIRRIHLAITLVISAALCLTVLASLRSLNQAHQQLQATIQENAALRKRAETAEANTRLVIERFAETMKALAKEAGHYSGRSLAKYEKSFVQVYGFYRTRGKDMATAGTACYLGGGYFLTAKHVVIPEAEPGQAAPRTTRITVRRNGQSQMLPVQLIDHGETQEKAVIDTEDWAVLFGTDVPEGLVPLKPTPGYAFMFGERLVRYGNDSNRGIAPAAGYVAQVSEGGWVSWLVDSLPGCSGGGVLNGNDEFVGLNGGYLDGSTRLAVIIPIRTEMLRKLPAQ